MVLKRCSKCDTEKPVDQFHKHRGHKDGLCSVCKPCTRAAVAAYRVSNIETIRAKKRKYHANNRKRLNSKSQAWRLKNQRRANTAKLRWAKSNQSKVSEANRRYRLANLEKEIERRRRHYRKNPKRYLHYCNKRRAALLKATPPWADLEAVARFYDNCPPGMVVDHVYPLQGKTVCGLHIASNLQYLTPSENQRKFNKLPETLANVGG